MPGMITLLTASTIGKWLLKEPVAEDLHAFTDA
jgi:hypothetical protein